MNQSVGSAHSPKSGGVIAGTTITQIITTTNEKSKEDYNADLCTLPVAPESNSLDYSKIIFRKEKGGINKEVKTLVYTPVCETLANKRKSLQMTQKQNSPTMESPRANKQIVREHEKEMLEIKQQEEDDLQ